MSASTTVRSWPAMAIGALFLGGTSFVLFGDVIDGAKITNSHVLTALALLGSTAAGHMIVTAWRERSIGRILGLALLTAASLAYVATMSGTRNAEQLVVKAERIADANAKRAEVKAELAKALKKQEAEHDRLSKQCRTGKGTKCIGTKEAADMIDSHVALLTARLDLLGAPEVANAGYRQVAESAILMGWSSRPVAELERVLVVMLPWLAVLIAEVGTIVFLGAAFGHAPKPSAQEIAAPAQAEAVAIDTDPTPPGTRAPERDEVIDWVRAYRARHGRDPQIKEVMAEWRLPKSTAHRRICSA